MSGIERVREKTVGNPQLVVTEGTGYIQVRPQGELSFTVGLVEEKSRYTVYFEGWHEQVETAEEALNLLAMGLSSDVRLKVISRGATDHCWTLETRDESGWTEAGTTGLLFFPFWRPKKVRYLQNAVAIRAPKP